MWKRNRHTYSKFIQFFFGYWLWKSQKFPFFEISDVWNLCSLLKTLIFVSNHSTSSIFGTSLPPPPIFRRSSFELVVPKQWICMWLCMHTLLQAAKNYPSFSMSIHQPMSLYKKKCTFVIRRTRSNSNWLSQCAVRKVIYFSYRLGKKRNIMWCWRILF